MKYTSDYKQLVIDYWNTHGSLETYKKFLDISRTSIRNWCDIEFKNKHCKKQKEWYDKNRDRASTNYNNFYKQNKLKLKVKSADWYKNNRDRASVNHKIWASKNRLSINLKRRLRRERDFSFKVRCTLSQRVWESVKSAFQKSNCKEYKKYSNTVNLLGCTIEQLIAHLQKQYQLGMNDQNYGKWHIDHIKPCSKFDLTKEEEQRKCFHYTNLQPLWAIDNLKKSDFFPNHEKIGLKIISNIEQS